MTCSTSNPSLPSAKTKCVPGQPDARPRHGKRLAKSTPILHKGFVRAEVVAYQDLLDLGSMAEAKAKAKLRLEGKEYIVKDGDIMHVRFNI